MVRGIHVEGQSEKKAIQTGIRSAEARNEWRLFKTSNIKSMYFTGRLFNKISLAGYNPNDSAMNRIITSFNPRKAAVYQKQLQAIKQKSTKPTVAPKMPVKNLFTQPSAFKKPEIVKAPEKSKEDAKNLEKKIDRLNNLL